MKNDIKKALALSVVSAVALGGFSSCGKTEETQETSESIPETVIIETTVASTSETVAASETSATAATSVEYIEMDADLQTYANTFLSNFAEVYMSCYERDSATTEQLLDFVHIHLKINSRDSITYMNSGDISYETFTFETAQNTVVNYFGMLLPDENLEGLPTPPDSYGDQPAGPYAADGSVWYEAADGEMYNLFAVVDSIENNSDGTLNLLFTVYQIDTAVYSQTDAAGMRTYYSLTPDEAAADSTLTAVTSGTAVVGVGQSGNYYLISYYTNN